MNAQFIYDGNGARVKSIINGMEDYFPGRHFQMTVNRNTNTYQRYYLAGAQAIAMRKTVNSTDTLSYILTDHLGSTSITTDAAGAKVYEQRYKPWGETRYSTPSVEALTKYQFTGQYSYESDFGLQFYNARFYDSTIGRFVSADSIVPPGIQGLDRYAYTFNNPVNFVDPSGHCAGEPDDKKILIMNAGNKLIKLKKPSPQLLLIQIIGLKKNPSWFSGHYLR